MIYTAKAISRAIHIYVFYEVANSYDLAILYNWSSDG